MDKIDVPNLKEKMRTSGSGDNNQKKRRKEMKRNIKVVHISNPLKVTLSASEYKERVQQLTGQDSYVADIMFQKAPVLPQPKEELHDQEDVHHVELPVPYPSTDNQVMSTSTPSSSGETPKDDLIPFDDFFYQHELIMATRYADLSYYQELIDTCI